MVFIITSDDPDEPCGRLYLVEAGPDYVYWTRSFALATRFLTYGHAKMRAERSLSHNRRYSITKVPDDGRTA